MKVEFIECVKRGLREGVIKSECEISKSCSKTEMPQPWLKIPFHDQTYHQNPPKTSDTNAGATRPFILSHGHSVLQGFHKLCEHFFHLAADAIKNLSLTFMTEWLCHRQQGWMLKKGWKAINVAAEMTGGVVIQKSQRMEKRCMVLHWGDIRDSWVCHWTFVSGGAVQCSFLWTES